MFIIEAIPLSEVLDFALSTVAVRNDTFDRLVEFEVLLLAFFVQEQRLALLRGKARCCEACLISFVRLDVVIHPFETLVSLEELVCLVGIS